MVRSDLHHFSDASESGYGEVTYNELHLDMYHCCSSACKCGGRVWSTFVV